MTLKYRREIDGLRAVAVLPVIFFHAGWSFWSGGFVGVDVFFVISGFLISTILIGEHQNKSFSFASFYERRARRILPALFVVVASCFLPAWYLLLPGDLKEFAKSVTSVFTFSSNIFFKHQSGYFDTSAELKPLLHTWSLAIEEQFYVVFPPLLWLTQRITRRYFSFALLTLLIASLVYSQDTLLVKPQAAYFLLPSRSWELLAGALTACILTAPRSRKVIETIPAKVQELLGASGLAMILLSMLLLSSKTPFPGFNALYPVIGTALIIVFSTQSTISGRFLSHSWFVGIGLISYSAYLWHQPLFSFARHRFIEGPSTLLMTCLVALSLVLSYLTWKFIETPARNKYILSRRGIFLLSAVATLCFIAIGSIGDKRNGFEQRLSPEQLLIFQYTKYDISSIWQERKCFLDPEQTFNEFSSECASGPGLEMLWGDSHAAALSPGVRAFHPQTIQYTASGCPPIKDFEDTWRPNCRAINDYVLREIARIKPSNIYLHADWMLYVGIDLTKKLKDTINYLHQIAPNAIITVVGGVPQYLPSLPVVMLRQKVLLDAEHKLKSTSYNEIKAADEIIKKGLGQGVSFVSALDVFCQHDLCRATVLQEREYKLTTWDYGHLTREGAILLARKALESNNL